MSRACRSRFLSPRFLPLGILAAGLAVSAAPTTHRQPPPKPALEARSTEFDKLFQSNLGSLPLAFEENRGQTHRSVLFQARGPGYQAFITRKSAVVALFKSERVGPERPDPCGPDPRPASRTIGTYVEMSFVGAKETGAKPIGLEPLPGKVNYFTNPDLQKSVTGIPTYRRVSIPNLYQGVDLVYYGNPQRLEYDLVVKPGADPSAIRLAFRGAGAVTAGHDGRLTLQTALGPAFLAAPKVYQEVDGKRVAIAAGYRIDERGRAAFQVASYDRRAQLVIDPVLEFSTYVGGTGSNVANAMALNPSTGGVIVAGRTDSATFPVTPGAFDTTFSSGDQAYVIGLSPDGSAELFGTFLGTAPSIADGAQSVVTDGSGHIYVAGEMGAIPTTPGAFLSSEETLSAVKLAPGGGALVYATYLGAGRLANGASALAGSDLVLAGVSGSGFVVTPGAFQTTGPVFVLRLNATGGGLVFSTRLGGTNPFAEAIGSVAVAPGGDILVSGTTFDSTFPVGAGGVQPTLRGSQEAFVVRLNGAGTARVAGTFLGGSDYEFRTFAGVDAAGFVYLAGTSDSSDFTTTPGAFKSPADFFFGRAPFVTKLTPDLSTFAYSTMVSEVAFEDIVGNLFVDADGHAHITGFSRIAWPTTTGAIQTTDDDVYNPFITKLSLDGSFLEYSTLLRGVHFTGLAYQTGIAILADAAGSIYTCGLTDKDDFPVTAGALQTTNTLGNHTSWVAKITPPTFSADLSIDSQVDSPDPTSSGNTVTYTTTVTNLGPDDATSATVTNVLSGGLVVASTFTSKGSCSVSGSTVTCALGGLNNGGTVTIAIVARALQTGIANATATVTTQGSTIDPNSANNSLSADTTVNNPSGQNADLVLNLADGPDPLSTGNTLTYTLTVTNQGPDTATGAQLTHVLPAAVTFGSAVASQGSCSGTAPISCALGDLASGATATVTVTTTAATAGNATSTAFVYSTSSDPFPASNSATASTRIALPGADVATTYAGPGSGLVGDTLTYTATVRNNGLDPATGVVTTITFPALVDVVSAVPSAGTCTGAPVVTCSLGNLPNGAVATIVVMVTPTDSGTVNTSASTATPTADPVSGNNSASLSTVITYPTAALSVTNVDSPDPTYLGGTVTYTVTVTNAGPQTATNVGLVDSIDASLAILTVNASQGSCTSGSGVSCFLDAIPAGSSATVTITARAQTAGVFSSTATVTVSEVDPNPSNNTATASTTVLDAADLQVTLADSPDPVEVGATLTYTTTVRNNGPSTANAVTLTISPDPSVTVLSAASAGGTCTTGATVTCALNDLAPGASVVTVLTVKPPTPGTVLTTATASSAVLDPNPTNNTATASTVVRPIADLEISMTDSADPINVGSNVTYSVKVKNNGPFAATNVTVTDELPSSVTFVSAVPGSGSCSGTSTVVCNLGGLAMNGEATLLVTVKGNTASVVKNTARVSASETDPVAANSSATVRTTVDSVNADLSLTMGHLGNFQVGSTGVMNLAVQNPGSSSVAWSLKVGSIANSRFSSDWTLDGPQMAATRAKLLNPANFGPGGTYSRPISITDTGAGTGSVSTALLGGFDVFFIGYLSDSSPNAFTPAEIAAFKAWVSDGGTMIASCDDFGYDAVCNAFGYYVQATLPPTSPITATAEGVNHPIFKGPFGSISSYNGSQTVGYFFNPNGGSILAQDPSGKAMMITAPYGQGRVILLSDVDHVAGALSAGSGIANSNDRLLGNLFSYAARSGLATITNPLPSGLSFLSSTGWSCSAVLQLVTCVSPGPVPNGTSQLTLTLAVSPNASGALVSTATMTAPGDTNPANNTTSDVVVIEGGAGGQKGDLDLNGARNVFDIVILSNYIVGNATPGVAPFLAPPSAADLDGDGDADVFDLVRLANCIVGNGGC